MPVDASLSADIQHGTYGGYIQHGKQRVKPCGACRAAASAYQRQWRSSKPELQRRHNEVKLARDRALRRLADLHPAELKTLYYDELRAAGLT